MVVEVWRGKRGSLENGYRLIAAKYGEDKWGWWPNAGLRYHRLGLWGAIALIGDV